MTTGATIAIDSKPLAVFDLDGTLVSRDTFLPFLLAYGWKRRTLRPFLALPLYLGLYACRLLSDQAAKERVLVSFFRGRSKKETAEDACRFAQTWVRHRLRIEVVERLREHQRAGHRVVLLSASPDVYVPAIAQELGIAEVVCTQVAGDETTWDGAIVGGNCKGSAKLDRLRAYLGCDQWGAETFAYGDRPHDLTVLRWAKSGFMFTRRRGLLRV